MTTRAPAHSPGPTWWSTFARLLALEAVLSPVEGWVVLTPLWTYFPAFRALSGSSLALGGALIVWLAAVAWWLRRLGPAMVEPDLLAARRTPGRALLLRLVLWATLATACALVLRSRGALAPGQGFTLFTIAMVHSLAIGLIRWSLQHRLLRSALSRALPESSWLSLQHATLFQRLVEVALLLGAVAGIFLSFFVYFFVPLAPEQYLRMETVFPWTAVGLGALWYFGLAPRQLAPLIEALRLASTGPLMPEVLQRAMSSVQRLPLRLALVKLGFFAASGLLLGLEAVLLFGFSLGQTAMVFGAIVIVTSGAALIEMIWSRAVLRPISAFLLVQPGAGRLPMSSPSLRRKMGLSFGGVMIFSVVLLLFWTFLQYSNLREEQTRTQAQLELETLLERVRLHPAALDDVRRGSLARPVVFVPPRGGAEPPFPAAALHLIRGREAGSLDLPDRGLTGAYQRIVPGSPASGSLLLLLPTTRSPRERLHLAGLILFFAVILGIGLSVVFATSAELTRPLRALEKRAATMTAGELDTPVLPAGEFDEVGRLGLALDAMRRALQGKIRAVEELNVELEGKVQARTAALELTNAELVQAISALHTAQDRLVTSEKLASVGQLVAGIAHEINNPINAVLNTVDPLVETAQELAQARTDVVTRQELATDIADMSRVIRSGAQRAQRIVQALRSLTRQDAETPAPMDLHADLEETLALLKHALRDIEVVRDFEASLPLRAYRGQLNQALLNLIANAAAALDRRPDGRILVRTRDLGERLEILVEDNGPGIPADILPKIFDPFFTTKEVGKGTGLGLSITLRIVERHQGTIRVESDSSGTRFTLLIPHAPVDDGATGA